MKRRCKVKERRCRFLGRAKRSQQADAKKRERAGSGRPTTPAKEKENEREQEQEEQEQEQEQENKQEHKQEQENKQEQEDEDEEEQEQEDEDEEMERELTTMFLRSSATVVALSLVSMASLYSLIAFFLSQPPMPACSPDGQLETNADWNHDVLRRVTSDVLQATCCGVLASSESNKRPFDRSRRPPSSSCAPCSSPT